MTGSRSFEVLPVSGIGEVFQGERLGELIAGAASLRNGDIVVVAQKIVSKAEGRMRRLDDVDPGPQALEIGAETDRDPRIVELVLDESQAVLRATKQALIVRTHHGLVCANAGIDSSNLPEAGSVLLLPADPDESARRIRREIADVDGVEVGILIADSFGRAWRIGQTDVAIGAAGVRVAIDWRGRSDSYGRELSATEVATGDQIAGAADLARAKDAGVPAVVVRGLGELVTAEDGTGAKALRRAEARDLFG